MSSKRVAILQSSYIPWKGYFDIISRVDEFVLYDDCQFTRRDWRNRNRVIGAEGPQWLTIPVSVKGRFTQRIDETMIDSDEWAEKHWRTITHSYARAPYFEAYRDRLEAFYAGQVPRSLSLVNRQLIDIVTEVLGISTPITWSTDYPTEGRSTERLVGICRAAGASVYLSGPAARAYLDEQQFADADVAVEYMDYSGYPPYAQLHAPFDHHVSVLDLLFNTGPDARSYMRGVSSPFKLERSP